MSIFDSFPLGRPAFVTHVLDRAAHLRTSDEKLFALEGQQNARAYVAYRDSLVMKQDEGGPRALLTIKEALGYGANPGTVFLGLRDGAPLFGMGISAAAAEKLIGRNDVAISELRGMVMQSVLPLEQLSAIAMAKSMVGWHQRHGFCANCGQRTSMKEGGWKRECPGCKVEHFPRTDPVVIMMVTSGERALLGRQKQFLPGMYSCLAGFVEAAETIEDAVAREIFEESGIRVKDVTYYMTQPWPYPSSLMIGCTAHAINEDIVVDRSELEDARWFDRDELTLMHKRNHPDGLFAAHPFAIAHHLIGQLAAWGKDRRRIAGNRLRSARLREDRIDMTDPGMNFHAKAPKIPPRILCIGMPVRDLAFRTPTVPARGSKENATAFGEICGGNALNAAIAIVRLGGRAVLCGPMGDAKETSARFIYEQMAHEGIDTKHLIHMPGLVTPISAVMIDPTGERTIVTFRDPDLWKVKLPKADTLLDDCQAILTESRCAEFCTDICTEAVRRGIPVIVDADRAMSLREGLLTASTHLVFSSEPLQETAGTPDDGEALKKIAKLTPSFLAGTRGPRGTIWLDQNGELQETPAFPVHTVDTLGAGDVFHGAFALAVTERQELRQALRFASAAAALKCTRFGGAFAAPQRAEVEELLSRGQSASPASATQ